MRRAVLLCLLSIAVRVVLGLGRTVQVTALGLALLVAGVVLVGGSAYYQANKEELQARLAELLGRFEGWE